MTSPLDSRQILRRQLRQARKNLSNHAQLIAAQTLVARVDHYLSDQQTDKLKKVALYFANDGEISPHLLCEYFWQQSIATYLPVIQGKQLGFARYTADSMWQENSYGIKEPVTADYAPSSDLDLVFLPLVGFDSQGGRLGMGGGFYDRTFANKQPDASPQLIGLAHECQQVKSLPVASWDVPLQAIITPQHSILVS